MSSDWKSSVARQWCHHFLSKQTFLENELKRHFISARWNNATTHLTPPQPLLQQTNTWVWVLIWRCSKIHIFSTKLCFTLFSFSFTLFHSFFCHVKFTLCSRVNFLFIKKRIKHNFEKYIGSTFFLNENRI